MKYYEENCEIFDNSNGGEYVIYNVCYKVCGVVIGDFIEVRIY